LGDVESNLKAVLTAAVDSNSDSTGGSSAGSSASVTTNKSAGIISILATEKQHIAAQKYLSEVEKHASAQVLIEAKVIQITLKDNYKTGIDWSFNGKFGYKNQGLVSQSGTNISDGVISIPTGSILTGIFGKNVTGTINALEEFGITKALSSPRVHAINNQKATISFTTKNVYFNVTNTQTGTTQSTNVVNTSTSTKVEQETGITLEITPSINLKTEEITMEIKPELSSVTDTVKDPVNTGNEVPVISSKKLETQVKVQSGNVIIIGGLMEQDNSNQDKGVPLIQRIPVLGWLFKSVSKTSTVKETVIFIKATIISSNTTPNKVDRELQEKLDANKRQFITQ
jgi:MSHA biogenesis protein MshL